MLRRQLQSQKDNLAAQERRGSKAKGRADGKGTKGGMQNSGTNKTGEMPWKRCRSLVQQQRQGK